MLGLCLLQGDQAATEALPKDGTICRRRRGEHLEKRREEEDMEVKVSRRMAELLEKNPSFTGDVPTPDQEKDWSDAELKNFIHSNGLIRPARTKGQQKPEPTAADWKVLELEPGADPAQLKKAYRRLALLYHPDKQRNEKDKASRLDDQT
eukprot:g22364.t1